VLFTATVQSTSPGCTRDEGRDDRTAEHKPQTIKTSCGRQRHLTRQAYPEKNRKRPASLLVSLIGTHRIVTCAWALLFSNTRSTVVELIFPGWAHISKQGGQGKEERERRREGKGSVRKTRSTLESSLPRDCFSEGTHFSDFNTKRALGATGKKGGVPNKFGCR